MITSVLRTKRFGVRVGLSLAALALVMTALLSASPPASSTTTARSTVSNEITILADPAGPFANGWSPFSFSNSAYIQGATAMIYEPLMQYNLLKVGQIYPWLATSWSWADNGTELVLHTRTGVKWTDGKPFSAADVAFTFNLMKKFPALDVNGVSFTGASAPSSTEAILKFASPAYTQLFDISQVLIVPEHVWKSISNPVTYVDDNPVGTGPYTVSSFTAEEFTLVRNPNYWQKGLPKIDTLHFLSYSSNTSAGLAIGSGMIDWNTDFMPNYKTGFLDKNPTTNHESVYPIGNFYMCPNLTVYPFNQTAVRKALSEAIDRNTIASEGEHGFYFADTSPTGLTIPRWSSWLAPQYSGSSLSFAPNAAKKLLEKNGFKLGSNGMLKEPNGKPFTVTLLGPTPYTDWMTDLELMVSEMAQAGIAATVSGVSVDAWTNDYTVGNYQLTFCGQFTTDDPYSMYNYMLNSALSAPIGKPATSDVERYNNAVADKALAAAAATDNHAALLKAYTTLEGLMVNDIPAIPLFNGGAWAGYTTTHATGWPSASNPYEMNDLESPWDEVVVLHLSPTK
ncbi:MAG: ABC transporter substrate-binding protein [Acidimicrobiales bacterium]|jgi:peptide/nickel transport system substrate-binding protein